MAAKRILIIDDNQDDVLITRRVLSRIAPGMVTDVAADGEAGLALLRNGRPLPDLILLDLKMPGMDGIEVLRRIRADEGLSRIPVVVVTHSALESDVTTSYREGANSVLQKSFDMDEFAENIQKILNRWVQ